MKSWETDSKAKPGVWAVVAGGRDSATPALCVCLACQRMSLRVPCVGMRDTWHQARGLVSGRLRI